MVRVCIVEGFSNNSTCKHVNCVQPWVDGSVCVKISAQVIDKIQCIRMRVILCMYV